MDGFGGSEFMYHSEELKKDRAFIEKWESIVSDKTVFMAHFLAFSACLAAHVMYLILFAAAGVWAMVIFNVFSVIFYILTIVLTGRVKDNMHLVYATLTEIIIHAVAATICIGLIPDFCMFLLMIIPLAFLMPNKNRQIPFVIMLVSVGLYGVLRFKFRAPDSAVYKLDDTAYLTFLYIINILAGSFVLIYVTTIYTFMRRYMECKIRVQTEQLKLLASTDPLTKLYNRREMGTILEGVRTNCGEKNTKYVVGIGDIDDFKQINDTYGHDCGDMVLSTIAKLITDSLPKGGNAARWGGEEFLFVLPDTDIKEALATSEKLIKTVENHSFTEDGIQFKVTMTVGICEALSSENTERVIYTADNRLYDGKRSGKNKVVYED